MTAPFLGSIVFSLDCQCYETDNIIPSLYTGVTTTLNSFSLLVINYTSIGLGMATNIPDVGATKSILQGFDIIYKRHDPLEVWQHIFISERKFNKEIGGMLATVTYVFRLAARTFLGTISVSDEKTVTMPEGGKTALLVSIFTDKTPCAKLHSGPNLKSFHSGRG